MARQVIQVGTSPNGTGGDTSRAAWNKANANFEELYAAVGGVTLGGVTGVTFGANTSLYATGADTFAAYTLTGFGRSLVGVADAAAAQIMLGLGSAATQSLSAFAAASHTHSASDTTGGVFAPARLGTGTADNTTFLRGDGSWQTPPSGGSLSDGDYDDVTVSGTGTAIAINPNVVTPGKLSRATFGKTLRTKGAGADSAYEDPAGDMYPQTYGGTTTFDLTNSCRQKVTLTGNPTFAVANDRDAIAWQILVTQDGTGGRTITWWSGVTWMDGADGVPASGPGKRTYYSFERVGAGDYLGWQSRES